MKYWLMKTEPTTYSFDDLLREGKTQWEGVRNYQARNFMRDDMTIGDKVLFYHSNCKPPGIVGTARVVRESYPDHFALDPKSKYFDPKASKDKPIWYMVDVEPVDTFKNVVSLDDLRDHPELADMIVLRKGSRLSVHPVDEAHYNYILKHLAKI